MSLRAHARSKFHFATNATTKLSTSLLDNPHRLDVVLGRAYDPTSVAIDEEDECMSSVD